MTKNSRRKKAIRTAMDATGEPYMKARARTSARHARPDSGFTYPMFPDEGTPEATRWHEAFREGKIILGPTEDGHEAVMDLNIDAHTLVAGATCTGKSALLTTVLYGALMNPDEIDVCMVDPKVTDFTWARGYPNVQMYAPTNVRTLHEEINAVIRYAFEDMSARRALLRQHRVENLRELRRGIRNGTITGITLDEVPKRLILFFEEGDFAFTPPKDDDLKALQDTYFTDLESIGMLSRAMEVNIVMAACKPSWENIGWLKAQMTNRVGVGYFSPRESQRVFNGTFAAEDVGVSNVPKGRGWFVARSEQALRFQSYFLPKRGIPHPDGTLPTVAGVQERVADRLGQLGWVPADRRSGAVTEWVRI